MISNHLASTSSNINFLRTILHQQNLDDSPPISARHVTYDNPTLEMITSRIAVLDRQRTNTPTSRLSHWRESSSILFPPTTTASTTNTAPGTTTTATTTTTVSPAMMKLSNYQKFAHRTILTAGSTVPIRVPRIAAFPATKKLHKTFATKAMLSASVSNLNRSEKNPTADRILFSRGLVDNIEMNHHHHHPSNYKTNKSSSNQHGIMNGSIQWEVLVDRSQSARLQPLTRQSFRVHLDDINRAKSFLVTSRAATIIR